MKQRRIWKIDQILHCMPRAVPKLVGEPVVAVLEIFEEPVLATTADEADKLVEVAVAAISS